MSGTDALLWHWEWPGNPAHTLKTVVVDPSRLGRQLTLADLRAALEPRLGLLPRLTHRAQAAPRLRARPFWVRLLTSDDPDGAVPTAPRPPTGTPVTDRDSQRAVLREAPRSSSGLRGSPRRAPRRTTGSALPPGAPGPAAVHRVAAYVPEPAVGARPAVHVRTALDFADIHAVSKAAAVTINGVYHTLIAAALRDELLLRGEDASTSLVAAFGIGAGDADVRHLHGNYVTPTNVCLFTNLEDPLERLVPTARSCRDGVELRKLTGVQMAGRWGRLHEPSRAVRRAAAAAIGSHVSSTTSRPPTCGGRQRRDGQGRRSGRLDLLALSTHPANLNVTGYSYAGRVSIGVVTTPEVLPEPRRLLDADGRGAPGAQGVAGRRACSDRRREVDIS